MKRRLSFGVDIGSVAVKAALLDDTRVVRVSYRRFIDGPFETLREMLEKEFPELTGVSFHFGLTGIGGKTASSVLGGKPFGEIAALAAGNFLVYPSARTVIEMGGEDSKLLILDGHNRTILDFAMNAQCAAGTGSFLDQQAARLNISIEDEFGRLALKSKNPPRIAGRCSVFAKSDMIHLQQIATPDHDIVAGLCFAVARNFKSSIARGKRFDKPIVFEGGVAANPGMVRAFTELLGLEKDELIVPEKFNVIGAIGAAMLATENEVVISSFSPEKIDDYLNYRQVAESGREALSYNFPESKHYATTLAVSEPGVDGLEVFLGIDVGSLSTNLVLIDRSHRVIARRYLMTEGRPIEAVRRGLAEIGEEIGDRVVVKAVGTTGSGRYLTGDYVGADNVRNEITAQATAAVSIDPTVDTVFEIGGQDSKYISIDNRAVIDFEMNKVCAAGTGSFLQEQADKLKINIVDDFGSQALCATCPVGCGERCTVFMESDLVAHQRSGARKDDLVAGLAYSIVSNYLTKVVGDRRVGDHIFFQGGVAWNKGVVAAFEKLTGKKITVPPHHDVTGAIGAAILAIEKSDEPGFQTRFRGFDLYKRKYSIDTFICEDCSNHCEIRQVEIEGDQTLYYGSRCEKYEVDSGDRQEPPPDYVKLRQKCLYGRHSDLKKAEKRRGRIGLPRILHFFDFYPFWRAFLDSLGFRVVLSNMSSQQIVEESLALFSAETCFPIKLVYGHIANLISKEVDTIFLPSLIRVAGDNQGAVEGGYICPYVQTIGSSIKARFDFEAAGIKFINSPVSFTTDLDELRHRFKSVQADLGLSDRELKEAVKAGLAAHRSFRQQLRDEGAKVLADVAPDEKVLVLVSRPYNGYDRRLSLDLPEKARSLGLKVIPLDFLPTWDDDVAMDRMYWEYGQQILKAAKYVRKHPNLFAVYVTSFGCGPDSFITHFFRRSMTGKPYLQLELDEHSADAGMITRLEAFVDSLRFYEFKPPITSFTVATDSFKPFEKTIYIPNMCDHAYALRAAMERFGLTAEVLDEPDEQTLEFGKRFTSGKECFPCVITTGDIIKKIGVKDFDPGRAVFFMPGADGPCRFGLYSQFHRIILDDLGYKDVPIFSPNSRDGYSEFGLEGTGFRSIAWKALVFVDCLIRMKHRTEPYEINKGETEKTYYHYLKRLDRAVPERESLNDLAEEAASAFADVDTVWDRRPVVGVVGEIYLRNNRYSNNHLIDKLHALGLEVWLASFAEWPFYTSLVYRRDAIQQRDLKGSITSFLQVFTQRWQERSLVRRFARHFDIGHDYPVDQVLRLAQKYLSIEHKGEAILSIGKAMEMSQEGASGIVNAMPFNCMPGTVVSSLSKKVADDLGGIPWLNISYEGLRDSGEDTRLEAFADQVKTFANRAAAAALLPTRQH